MKNIIADFYLQFLNEFLTLAGFAAWHGMSEEDAQVLIDMGRRMQGERASCADNE